MLVLRNNYRNFPSLFSYMNAMENGNDKNQHSPAVNISENDNLFMVEFAVPGMQKDDIEIKVENEHLRVSTKEREVKDDNYLRQEFSTQYNFEKDYVLPENVDAEAIKAECKNGVLSISIPKKEETKLIKNITVA